MPLPNFNHDDVIAIELFADILQRKSAYGSIPTTLHVGGCDVPIRPTTPDGISGHLGETDLRALYSTTLKDIQLQCSGVTLPRSVAAKHHIVGVIGHEALHAIQRKHFSDDEIELASELSKKAEETPDAYEAYISCDVELPAHAMMIALALRDQSPLDFAAAAQNTAIYGYFAERLSEASNGPSTLVKLIAAAAAMHKVLAPI